MNHEEVGEFSEEKEFELTEAFTDRLDREHEMRDTSGELTDEQTEAITRALLRGTNPPEDPS